MLFLTSLVRESGAKQPMASGRVVEQQGRRCGRGFPLLPGEVGPGGGDPRKSFEINMTNPVF